MHTVLGMQLHILSMEICLCPTQCGFSFVQMIIQSLWAIPPSLLQTFFKGNVVNICIRTTRLGSSVMAVLKITLQIWVVERNQGSSCSQAAQSSPCTSNHCIIGSITRGLCLDGQTLKHSHPLALGRLDRQMAPTERWVRKMQGGIFSPHGCCQVLQSTRGALRSRSKASPPGSSEEKHFLSSATNLTRGITADTRFPVELRIWLFPLWLSNCIRPQNQPQR